MNECLLYEDSGIQNFVWATVRFYTTACNNPNGFMKSIFNYLLTKNRSNNKWLQHSACGYCTCTQINEAKFLSVMTSVKQQIYQFPFPYDVPIARNKNDAFLLETLHFHLGEGMTGEFIFLLARSRLECNKLIQCGK